MAIKIVPEDSAPLDNYEGVAFANGCDGVAVGEAGAIATTNDGGVSWTEQGSGFTGTSRDAAFAGPNKMVAVGGNPLTIINSTDSGLTWHVPADPVRFHDNPRNALFGVGFADQDLGFAVGEAFVDIMPSTSSTSPSINSHIAVAVGAGTTGIVGAIIRTDNGGNTWNLQTSGSPTPG